MPAATDYAIIDIDAIRNFTDPDDNTANVRGEIKHYVIKANHADHSWTHGRPVGCFSCPDSGTPIKVVNWVPGTETYFIRGRLENGQLTKSQSVAVTMSTPADHRDETSRDETTEGGGWAESKSNTEKSGTSLVLSAGETEGTYETSQIDMGSLGYWRVGILIHVLGTNALMTFAGQAVSSMSGQTLQDLSDTYHTLNYRSFSNPTAQAMDIHCNDIYNPTQDWTLESTVYTTDEVPGTYKTHETGVYYGRYLKFKITLTRTDTTDETLSVVACTTTYSRPPRGDVTGPASSTSGNLPTFADTTGEVVQDSGKSLPTGDIIGTTDTQTLTNKTIGAATIDGDFDFQSTYGLTKVVDIEIASPSTAYGATVRSASGFTKSYYVDFPETTEAGGSTLTPALLEQGTTGTPQDFAGFCLFSGGLQIVAMSFDILKPGWSNKVSIAPPGSEPAGEWAVTIPDPGGNDTAALLAIDNAFTGDNTFTGQTKIQNAGDLMIQDSAGNYITVDIADQGTNYSATIPALDANDTFAMLGLDNVFVGDQRIDGSLGLNTDPDRMLHLYGNGAWNSTAAPIIYFENFTAGGEDWFIHASNSGQLQIGQGDGDTRVLWEYDGAAYFYKNIFFEDRVTVNEDLVFRGGASYPFGTNNQFYMVVDANDNDPAPTLVFTIYDGGGTDYFNILKDGKIGIGTTGPATIVHSYENSSSTSGGVTIEQDGTGDAVLQFLLTGGERWMVGIDNGDGDKFKIADSTDLGTTTRLAIDSSGNIVWIGTLSATTVDQSGGTLKIAEKSGGATVNGELAYDTDSDELTLKRSSDGTVMRVQMA